MRASHVTRRTNVPIEVEYQGDVMAATYRRGVATPAYLDTVQDTESADGQADVICQLIDSWEFYGTVETMLLTLNEGAEDDEQIGFTMGRADEEPVTYYVPVTATAEEIERFCEGGPDLFEVSGEPGEWTIRYMVELLGEVDVEGPVQVEREVEESHHFKQPKFDLVRRLPLEFLNAVFQAIMDTMRPKTGQQRQSAGGSRARERAQRGRKR